ncbi:copper resistance CopC family protein [Microbacterium pygmaeum]|uniref:copper resistance CopC family protein n=1 Tax=Microbacterium pygmaeum TaxID=370764 RepID=UPI000B85158C|nr:copper resistance CopC family protein [Microbacterium pygmaeum]
MPTTTTSPRRPFARAAAAAVAALLLSAGGLLVASPASAHDELVSADPAADATLDALPTQLTLTFSGEIATDAGASEVQVTDAAGTTLADGAPVAQSNVLTQALTGEASGAITVLWKVVSSDGHPISGQYSFTVSGAATPTPTPTETPTASPAPVSTPSEQASTAPPVAPVPAEDTTTAQAWPWVVGGIVLVAVAGGIVYLLVSRARQQRALAENRANALGDPAGTSRPTGTPDATGSGSRSGSEPPTER